MMRGAVSCCLLLLGCPSASRDTITAAEVWALLELEGCGAGTIVQVAEDGERLACRSLADVMADAANLTPPPFATLDDLPTVGAGRQLATLPEGGPDAVETWAAGQGFTDPPTGKRYALLDLGEEVVTTSDLDPTAVALRSELTSAVGAVETRVAALESWRQSVSMAVDDLEDVVANAPVLLSADLTLPVPSAAYPTLRDALAWLDPRLISPAATVTISLADGIHGFTAPVVLRHPSGGRLRIVGNEADPTAVVLRFQGSSGIVVTEGASLGYLGGVSVEGNTTASTSGLIAAEGATVHLGPSRFSQFGQAGILVQSHGKVLADDSVTTTRGWLTVEDNFYSGLEVRDGGLASLPAIRALGNHSNGVYVVSAIARIGQAGEGALLADNTRSGLHVIANGVASADGAESKTNGLHGFLVAGGSYMDAGGASSTDNSGYGIRVEHGAVAETTGAKVVRKAGQVEPGIFATLGSDIRVDNSSVGGGSGGSAFAATRSSTMTANPATVLPSASANVCFAAEYLSYALVEGQTCAGTTVLSPDATSWIE